MADDASPISAAFALHAAGRRDEAARLCAGVLHADPYQIEAAYLLGVLYAESGRAAAARHLLSWTVGLLPAAAVLLLNLAHTLHDDGDPAAAERAYVRALRLDPGLADAAACRARSLRALGREAAAESACRRALALDPAHADALVNRADALLALGDGERSLIAAARAERTRPGRPQPAMIEGMALASLGRVAPALVALRSAVARAPGWAEAHANLGTVLAKAGEAAEAVAALDTAAGLAARAGGSAAPLAGLLAGLRGQALLSLGRPEEAAQAFEAALACRPGDAGLHWNRAFALLLAGRYAEAWPDFEWRRLDRRAEPPWRHLDRPSWRGEPLAGRTILLYAEQGIGDTLQFLRFVPLVAAAGGRVVLEVQPSLRLLAQGVEGAAQVICRGESLPAFDVECPLMSVPGALGMALDDVPATVPYVRVESGRAAAWTARLSGPPGLRVGLVWAGNPRFPGDRLRSPRLDGLAPVLDVPGVRFFGLQVGDGRRDLGTVELPPGFTDLGPALTDFAETAAVMSCLDLVISSCTAPAHLAGALGRPVWLVLPAAPDWRWLLGRSDSPWYPTARLFRQTRPGAWAEVAGRLAAALTAKAARAAAGATTGS